MFHAAAAGHPSQVVGTQMQFPCESLDPLTQLSGADLANKPGSCTGLLVQGRAAVWPHPGEGAMSQQTGRKSLKDPDPNPPNSIPFRSVPFHSIQLAGDWRQAEHQRVRPEMRWQAGSGHKLKPGQCLGCVWLQETLTPE